MSIPVTNAIDVTAENYPYAPVKNIQVCLYVTGTAGIVATTAMRLAHPSAVLIDQSPESSAWDATADVQDYENGAVTLSELPGRYATMRAAFASGVRPEQRTPAIYASKDSIPDVGEAVPGCNVWVADYSLTVDEAIALLGTKMNGCTVIGVQYEDAGAFDRDVFDTTWLNDKNSGKPTPPPGQWKNADEWTWWTVAITGVGLDGKEYTFHYDNETGEWS